MLSDRWYPLREHALQQEVMAKAAQHRYAMLPCGRRSGKTELAKRFLVANAITPRPHIPWKRRYFAAAPTHQQAKNLYWEDLKALSKGFTKRIYEGELRIVFNDKSFSELVVLSMDKPARFEGAPWDGGVLDEYADMHARAWPQHVRPGLADRQGWCWFTGVPEGRNHYYDMWIEKQTDPEWLCRTWYSETVLPVHEVEAMRRDMDEQTFEQEAHASFVQAKGRIYYAFTREANVRTFDLPRSPTGVPLVGTPSFPWEIGMDFNVDPFCAVVFYTLGETIFIWDEVSVRGGYTQPVGKALKEGGPVSHEHGRYFPAIVYPDPSGKGRHTGSGPDVTDHSLLRELGYQVRAREGAPSLRARYNAMNSRLLSMDGERRIVVHPRCKYLVKCLEGQTYPEGRNEEDKRDPLGHINAALGYAVEWKFPIRPTGGIGTAQF